MTRFHFLTVGAFAAALLIGFNVLRLQAAVPGAGHSDHHAGHGHFDECARTCAACLVECESCYAHCAGLVADGNTDHAASMRLCNDCADLCRSAATLAARGSEFSVAACETCATACDQCAEACGAFPDDAHLQACAQSCRECAAACRAMVAHANHHS